MMISFATWGFRKSSFLFISIFLSSLSIPALSFAQKSCSDDENVRRRNYSLYYEYWKNQSFDDALPYLRWILECAPGFPSGSDRNYRRAIDAYEGIGLASEDPATRRTYLDSALYIHGVAVTNLQDAGIAVDEYEWTLKKGRFIQNHAENLRDIQNDVGSIYRDAFDLNPIRMESYYINFIVNDYVQKDQNKLAIEFMDLVENSIPKENVTTEIITQWRQRLFTSPEEWIDFLEGQLDDDPDNLTLLYDLFELYVDEQMRDMAYDISERLLELDSVAKTYRRIAKMRLDDGESDLAIELYDRSITLEGGQEGIPEVHFNIGIAHQQEGRLSKARSSFRETLSARPDYAEALVAIGDLYVAAVQGCGTFEREDRAVYWLAADYYDRATATADEVSSLSRSRLSSILSYFPTTEDKFFKGWETGDTYTIDYGCFSWIGESTRIR